MGPLLFENGKAAQAQALGMFRPVYQQDHQQFSNGVGMEPSSRLQIPMSAASAAAASRGLRIPPALTSPMTGLLWILNSLCAKI